ncbi:MAG TPA: glutamine synthetase type III [Bacteroidetes bacterium]|nr:glutamine synthetase type III [Bacteroidota bacterium]
MAQFRTIAFQEVLKRQPVNVKAPSNDVTVYFGSKVFDLEKMQKYLSKEAYKSVRQAIREGTHIDRKMANQVAAGMKNWAIDNGATHYTHWFHPLTDGTAEKHDGFIDFGDSGVVENFSGELLVQQEPDASSFPSGGIRNTFEARGYTAWDVSSPAFLIDTTLCIPTVFVSYTGEALDYKAPLLRALSILDKAAVDVCRYFDKNVNKVFATLGWEQEYFLIDDAFYNARPDLILTGRTLVGHQSPKDQQLGDHYFSSIPERVKAFMEDFEIESYKLGIPVKTRHNEVAPNQYECAPIFEEVNLANDHNQIIMDLMKRVARHHNFRVLFHEKPFAGINGSGKHNNWSLVTDTGVNLLSPGKNPMGNLQFLTFLVNVIKTVHDNQDILRASILTAGNSHRLGGDEAPPAILSIFLGSTLSKILADLEKNVPNNKMTPEEKTELKLGIGKIPEILLDNTDRNRTSPFAFTGNRFEFRAVGSSANCAAPMIVLNSALAYQLKEFKKEVDSLIERKNLKKDEAIFKVLRKYITKSKNILFEGDNYSDEWKKEAEKRGLSNIINVPESLSKYLTPQAKKVLIDNGIFDERELKGRVEVEYEKFTKKIQIEARVLGDLAINHIVPTAVQYQNKLIENVKGLKDLFTEEEFKEQANHRMEIIKNISKHVSIIKSKVTEMINARKVANKIKDVVEKAYAYDTTVRPFLDEIRYHADKLELIIDDELWPLPKYREILFTR